MSLGISAAGWAAIGAVGSTAVGAMAGSGGSSSSETKSNSMDPRMDKYVYGADGNGGLLGDANSWYQSNKTGMNDQMRQGLNQQWQTFNDPATMAGYRQMSNLGSGLMGAPVMGNPFSDGRMSLNSGTSNLGFGGAGAGGGGGFTFGGSAPRPQYPSYQPVNTGAVPPATAGSGPFAAPPPAPPAPPPPAAAPAPGVYPGMTAQQPEVFYMDEAGNMYVSRNGQPPVGAWGNGGGFGGDGPSPGNGDGGPAGAGF